MVNYKRIDPEYKNLKYKKILNHLSRVNISEVDIALHKNKKILETGTANILFVRENKIYSPIKNFYKGTVDKKKELDLNKSDNELNNDEIGYQKSDIDNNGSNSNDDDIK